ncbi:hypothetical protein BGY98DRAFT_987184, partial [Russula aff. rugulosa BPL654]
MRANKTGAQRAEGNGHHSTPPNDFFPTIMLASPLYFFILALVAAVGVSAQTADACTLACLVLSSLNLTHAAHIRSTDLSCVCNSTSFQETAASCLVANCTAADQQAAQELQKEECGSMYLPTNSFHHFSPLTRFPSFPYFQFDVVVSPSTSSKSSGATGSIDQLPFITAVIAIAGVALGGAFA